MEQSPVVETLETSLIANIWAERRLIISLIIVVILSIYFHLDVPKIFEVMFGAFLFVGIFFFSFVAIAAHVKYYFYFERNRKVELYSDRMILTVNGQEMNQILKKDIIQITLYDKRHVDEANLFPIHLDSFYYLTITGKNSQKVILTCLLDVRLKAKITSWYGQELKHIYQFFPFPSNQ